MADIPVSEFIINELTKTQLDNLVSTSTVPPNQVFFVNDELEENILINKIYPLGSIYMSVVNKSPASFIGGTWRQLKDTFLLAHGDNYTSTASSNITQVTAESGSATHTLTVAEMPTHTHRVRTNNIWSGNVIGLNYSSNARGVGAVEQSGGTQSYVTNLGSGVQVLESTGDGSTHNNMPPYLVVYMWKRTA